jgi:hypothetical protein
VEQLNATPLPVQNNTTESTPIYLSCMVTYVFDSLYCFMLQVIENKMLRTVFGPKKNDSEEFRTVHNVKRGDICRSCRIVIIRKSRRKCWTEHLGTMGEPKKRTEFDGEIS